MDAKRLVLELMETCDDEELDFEVKQQRVKTVRESLVELGEEAVEPLIERLERGGADARLQIIEVLGTIASRTALPTLSQALLADDSPAVRTTAAEALARIGGQKAVEALIKALKHDYLYTRVSAIHALAQLRAKVALKPLEKIIHHDLPLSAREAKVATIQIKEGTIGLAKAYHEADAPQMRYSLISALGYTGEANALSPILEALQSDNETLRDYALGALETLSQTLKVESALVRQAATEAAKVIIGDPSGRRRIAAASVLETLGLEAVIEPLRTTYTRIQAA